MMSRVCVSLSMCIAKLREEEDRGDCAVGRVVQWQGMNLLFVNVSSRLRANVYVRDAGIASVLND